MKLYLARHTRTNYNDLQLCNADPAVDVHLTPIGITQAETLAKKLEHVDFDHIFVSELRRTKQTAEIINKFHNVAIEIDPRLNDGRSGFEGKPFEEYMQVFNAAKNKWTARFNDGESVEDIKQRVAGFIHDLQIKDYDAVLIVTSYWLIQAILAVVRDIPLAEAWEVEVSQGGYMELEI